MSATRTDADRQGSRVPSRLTLNPAATRSSLRLHRRGRGVERKDNPLWGLLAWVIGFLFVAPVLWMLLTSFHSEADAATNPPSVAAQLTLDGYRSFFGGASPWPPLINSLTASVVSTILVLLLAFPAAYALSIKPVAKWRWTTLASWSCSTPP